MRTSPGTFLKSLVVAVLFCAGMAASAATQEPGSYPAVPYPTGYREWTHVKSNFIGPKHPMYQEIGGYQHIYANKEGMDGYRTGRFPEGSILVYDFLQSQETESGSIIEGARRFTSVMVKDTKRYAATGGWGYEEFRGDSSTDRMIAAEASSKCLACHMNRKDNDYVFSKFRK
jgi:hypothetical protein